MEAACWNSDAALRMSLITYVWGMSRMNESCHMCLHMTEWKRPPDNHIPPYECVMSPMNESCCIWMHMDERKMLVEKHRPPCEWVLSRIYEACRTRVSHFTCDCTWISGSSLVTPTYHPANESCLVWMSHVAYKCTWITRSCLLKAHAALWRSRISYIWGMS